LYFYQQLATFVRTHEKALANALQFKRQNLPRHGSSQSVSSISSVALSAAQAVPERPSTSASTSSSLAAALSLGSLSFTSHTVRSAKLALTPHHLFYLLSRFEELGIPVGPMKVRLENLHDSTTSANYVSFLSQSHRSKSRSSDVGSIRSVSSIRSVMSGMSALWASFGIGSGVSAARNERQKAALLADLKYLYSAFTKIPCLKLSPDWRARLIRGYEEFPFDSAVPLYVFKNVQALEVSDLDFRQFFGWDRLADQLRSLTIRRACLDDPADVLIDIVLDDMDKRRRRTSKSQNSPTTGFPGSASPKRSPKMGHAEVQKTSSAPGSPNPRKSGGELPVGSLSSEGGADSDGRVDHDSRRPSIARADSDEPRSPTKTTRPRSNSPRRPSSSRNGSHNVRGSYKVRRSGSGSSHSSMSDSWHNHRGSSSNLLAMGILPASKWRFLKHLSLTDNSLTSIPANSLAPLATTLNSIYLSCNLFTQIPDSLASLTALRALNLSHCMIDSLHSLTRNPLPAITALNLRANRLQSIAGVERLYPLERLDLRDNRLTDPSELARLTGIPEIREVWVEGNPFTRSHKDYRVTIFNLFRMTPGYTEDIIIDDAGPSYSERKYLVERVAEPAAVPVVKPPVPEIPAVDVSKPTIIYGDAKEPAVLRKERPTPRAASSEVNTGSTRRRRAAKRRIVDLATTDVAVPHAQPIGRASVEESAPRPITEPQDSYYRISQSPDVQDTSGTSERPHLGSQSSPEVPRIDSSVVPQLPPIYTSSGDESGWKDPKDWDLGGELYRQKIETLRDKVGSGYLSVLGENGWESGRPPSYHDPDFGSPSPHSPHHSSTSTPRAVGVQAIHSGRTLG
jgi:hypothetical protein